MPKARLLLIGDELIYPISVFDLIINPDTRKTLTETLALIEETLENKANKTDEGTNFTLELKEKLESLHNYDDTVIRDRMQALENWKETMSSSTADEVINTFKEIEDFLSGVTGADSLTKMLSDMRTRILSEVDDKGYVNPDIVSQMISEALTPYVTRASLSPVAFSGDYRELNNKPVVDTVLSASSDNAIANKTVAQTVDTLVPKSVAVIMGEESEKNYEDVTSFVL